MFTLITNKSLLLIEINIVISYESLVIIFSWLMISKVLKRIIFYIIAVTNERSYEVHFYLNIRIILNGTKMYRKYLFGKYVYSNTFRNIIFLFFF